MTKIDLNKKYRTRAGNEVRLYADDGMNPYPIHGAVKREEGWSDETWTEKGEYNHKRKNHPNDLVEVKPRIQREYWANIYPCTNSGYLHSSKEFADRLQSKPRIACVKVIIDCEEGEGLDE